MEIVRKVLMKDKTVPNDKIDDMILTLREAQDHVMRPRVEDVIQSVRNGMKICSFCATIEPVSMWSHYADSHQGFCMEYDVAKLPDMTKRMLFPVIYSSSLFDCTKYYAEALSSLERLNNIYSILQALYKAP